MRTQRVGDIAIDRVLESESPYFDVDFLLPDAPPHLIDDNADWLKPQFVDPASGKAILSFHSLLLRAPGRTILVDCCVGNDKVRHGRPNWTNQSFPWLQNLKALGVAPDDIDVVMCTHLHADHVGWNTKLENGRWVPTFPNARYVFARTEYAHWEAEHRAARAAGEVPILHGAFEDSVLPVVAAGRADLVARDHELARGIWLEPAPGHTPGNVVVRVEDSGGKAVLVGDVMHTAAQLGMPELSSRFCADPALSAETRVRLVERIAETGTILLTAHFPTPTAGRIERRRDAFMLATD